MDKEVWQYEICNVSTDIGSIDANNLLEDDWEPFSSTADEDGIYLFLRKRAIIRIKKKKEVGI